MRGPLPDDRHRWSSVILAGVAVVCGAVLAVTPLRLLATYAALSRVPLSHFEIDGSRVEMVGAINRRSPEQFRRLLDDHPAVDTLVLVDVTGSIDDRATFDMARIVRQRGLDTEVPSGGVAESGGVDLFIAGVERSLGSGARLGVHEWRGFDARASDFSRSDPAHRPYVAFYTEMLGSADFYWFTIAAAPPDGMHHLTAAEIERFELVTEGVDK